jgi:uncharacterized membrane protein YcaP (DUF421 family)
MNSVLNAAGIYFFLLVVFRIAGRRTIAEMTTFDFILILIVSEATQGALVGNDNSFTNSALLILTLIGIDIGLSLLKQGSKTMEKWMDGVPLVIVRDGKPIQPFLQRSRVDIDDILSAARGTRGVANLDSIAYAVLETNGHITVIPVKDSK